MLSLAELKTRQLAKVSSTQRASVSVFTVREVRSIGRTRFVSYYPARGSPKMTHKRHVYSGVTIAVPRTVL